MLVRLHVAQLLRLLERANDPLACFEPVDAEQVRRNAIVRVSAVGHGAVRRHDDRHRELVSLADLEIVGIVRRRDLDDAASERWIDVLVGDDRDPDVGDRNQDVAPDEILESLVVGVNRERNVAEHRLRARGRDGQVQLCPGSPAIGKRVKDRDRDCPFPRCARPPRR